MKKVNSSTAQLNDYYQNDLTLDHSIYNLSSNFLTLLDYK